MWLVMGLGNPGPRYARTRHNAGARAVEGLSARLGVRLERARSGLRLAEATHESGERLVVGRTTGFMNESGGPVAAACRRFRVDAPHLIVVHDDIDLAQGSIRVKKGGGTGGHHGLDSVIEAISSRDFCRVRIGVGRPQEGMDGADWVLARMDPAAEEALATAEEEAAEAVLAVVSRGVERAMEAVNRREKPQPGPAPTANW